MVRLRQNLRTPIEQIVWRSRRRAPRGPLDATQIGAQPAIPPLPPPLLPSLPGPPLELPPLSSPSPPGPPSEPPPLAPRRHFRRCLRHALLPPRPSSRKTGCGGQKSSICEPLGSEMTTRSRFRRYYPRSDFYTEVSFRILLTYRRFLSAKAGFRERRRRAGGRVPKVGVTTPLARRGIQPARANGATCGHHRSLRARFSPGHSAAASSAPPISPHAGAAREAG